MHAELTWNHEGHWPKYVYMEAIDITSLIHNYIYIYIVHVPQIHKTWCTQGHENSIYIVLSLVLII